MGVKLELPVLYSMKELAQILGVSKRTAQKIIRNGEIRVVKVGARDRVRHEALEEYLARQE